MNRSSVNVVVDMAIGAAFFISLSSTRHEILHIGAGIVLVCGSAAHIALHRRWLITHTRWMFAGRSIRRRGCESGRISLATRTNYILDLMIFATFAVCAVSGIALLLSTSATLTGIHSMSSGLFAVGTLAHMMLKWRSLMGITGKVFRRMLALFARTAKRSADA